MKQTGEMITPEKFCDQCTLKDGYAKCYAIVNPSYKPEHRREYGENDEVVCPRCEGGNLKTDEAPNLVECSDCGLRFTVRQVAVWKDQPEKPHYWDAEGNVLDVGDKLEALVDIHYGDRAYQYIPKGTVVTVVGLTDQNECVTLEEYPDEFGPYATTAFKKVGGIEPG